MSIGAEVTRVMLSPLLWIIVIGVMILFSFGALWVRKQKKIGIYVLCYKNNWKW